MYRITLQPLNKEPKMMASVLRRVQSCSNDPPRFNNLQHHGRQLTKHLTETIGVKEDYILKVMKVMQPLFSYVQEKDLTEPQIEQREWKSVQKEESRKEGKSDGKNKKGNCRKQQKMTEEASEPTNKHTGDNTSVKCRPRKHGRMTPSRICASIKPQFL